MSNSARISFSPDESPTAGTGFEICTVAANCQAGSGGDFGGELSGAGGVATDGAGDVYFADGGNARIQKFDSSGNFLRTWGKDVDSVAAGTGFEICTVAVNCQAGSPGGLGGEFGYPGDVGSDAAGNVYVLDVGRINKFAADPLPPTPPPAAAGSPAPTGKRAAALKKCKKTYKKNHDKKKFKNCKKKANQLPV